MSALSPDEKRWLRIRAQVRRKYLAEGNGKLLLAAARGALSRAIPLVQEDDAVALEYLRAAIDKIQAGERVEDAMLIKRKRGRQKTVDFLKLAQVEKMRAAHANKKRGKEIAAGKIGMSERTARRYAAMLKTKT